MRQFFFAVVLVGAAFGGGAMVNGPGFRWAQDHFFNYMGLKDGGEIASVDLPPAPGDDEADLDQPLTGPAALKAERAATAEELGMPRPDRKPRSLAAGGQAPATPPEPKSDEHVTPAAAPTPPPLAGPSGAPGPEPGAPPAPLDPGVAPTLLTSLSPAPSNPPPAPTPTPVPVPSPAPESPAETKPAPAAAPVAAGGGDWAELRSQLKAQGVTRYTIEADTGGRVLFSCLIPLAGKQAVSQRFEAEGDDEFAAARATLRRILLWRATQAPAAAPPASS